MSAALRYEWVRSTTVRSTRILLVLTLLLGAGLGYLIAEPHRALDETGHAVGPELTQWYLAFSAPMLLTAVLASVVASQAIGQEYRFGLIRLTLTAFPDRVQVLVAKLGLVVLLGATFAAVSYLGSEIGVALRGHPVPPGDAVAPDPTILWRGAVFVLLWGLSAFAIAGVTRQTSVGIAVPVVLGLVAENLLTAFLGDKLTWLDQVLPWSNAQRWAQPVSPGGAPAAWGAVGVFAVWVLAFLVVETLTFLRRDA